MITHMLRPFLILFGLSCFSTPTQGEYLKGLHYYQQDNISSALREFRAAARKKDFRNYQSVIRDMSQLEPSASPDANAEIVKTLGVAAKQGSAEAQLWMSRLVTKFGGDFAAREPGRIYWLTLAAKQGNVEAAWELSKGSALAESQLDRVYWLRRAAELGHESAQLDLALAYLRGNKGVQRDTDAATRLAATLGKANDRFSIGWAGYIYATAGSDANYAEAIRLLRQAWDEGFQGWPVAHTLVKLYDENRDSAATESEVARWREAARAKVIID